MSRMLPTGRPVDVVTRMPVTARPMVQPVIVGRSHRFTSVARKAAANTSMNTHHSQPPTAVVYASRPIVAITAAPGRTSSAMAPARAGQEAKRVTSSCAVRGSVSSSSTAVTR
jgi:hypothetical protein